MLEKLVENWLDSAGERTYQAAFCQMLNGSGHTVVHSTRHAPTEFGKDVITIDDAGVPWAFQLKGNPGSRLTKTQVAEIAPQLEELVVYAIQHPSVPAQKHKCVLVTNGQVDEEALEAINKINESLARRGHGKNRIKIWTRGHLMKMATSLGVNLWPSEFDDLNGLLELLVAPGRDLLPHETLHRLLAKILLLSETEPQKVPKAELLRRVTSAALLVGIALRTFTEKRNHYAILTAWIMFQTYVIASINKHGFVMSGSAQSAVALARATCFDCLTAMCEELKENSRAVPMAGSVIASIQKGRLTLIYALMAAYWLWAEKEGWPLGDHKAFIEGWLPVNIAEGSIWGEGAIPHKLAHHWYAVHNDPTSGTEQQLRGLTEFDIMGCRGLTPFSLPSPYYTFEQILRHDLGGVMPVADDPLRYESVTGNSFFAEALLHLLVRTNRKADCQVLFPQFTHLVLRAFKPEMPWAFGMVKCERGTENSVVPKIDRSWSDLIEEARDCRLQDVPKQFADDPFMLLLFVVAFPYRANTSIIRFLDRKLGVTWMIPAPPLL